MSKPIIVRAWPARYKAARVQICEDRST